MYFSKQDKVKQSTEFSSAKSFNLGQGGSSRTRASVQRDNVWYDAKDGRCVCTAPAGHAVAMALPQTVGRHKAAVAATTASVGGWQRSASSST